MTKAGERLIAAAKEAREIVKADATATCPQCGAMNNLLQELLNAIEAQQQLIEVLLEHSKKGRGRGD